MPYEHLADKREALEREITEAIWSATGGLPRLLYETCRPGTNLDEQQSLCRKQASAVMAALDQQPRIGKTMIADPFFLHHIVSANAEVATAMENISSDDPGYEEKHDALVVISKHLEALIIREVSQ